MLNYIGFACGLLPVLAGIFNYKNLDNTLKILASFFLLNFLVDFLLWLTFIKYLAIEYNHPLLYVSILTNIFFYTFLYYRSFYSYQTKKFTIYSGIVSALLVIISLVVNGVQKYPDWANTALGLYMMVLSLLFLYQIFNRQEFMEIEKQSLFWINSGVLIYFSSTIFLYMLAERIKIEIHEYFIINAIANIISNLLFAIGLSCKIQKTV